MTYFRHISVRIAAITFSAILVQSMLIAENNDDGQPDVVVRGETGLIDFSFQWKDAGHNQFVADMTYKKGQIELVYVIFYHGDKRLEADVIPGNVFQKSGKTYTRYLPKPQEWLADGTVVYSADIPKTTKIIVHVATEKEEAGRIPQQYGFDPDSLNAYRITYETLAAIPKGRGLAAEFVKPIAELGSAGIRAAIEILNETDSEMRVRANTYLIRCAWGNEINFPKGIPFKTTEAYAVTAEQWSTIRQAWQKWYNQHRDRIEDPDFDCLRVPPSALKKRAK